MTCSALLPRLRSRVTITGEPALDFIRLAHRAVSSAQRSHIHLAFSFPFSCFRLTVPIPLNSSFHCYADEAQLTRLYKSKWDESHFYSLPRWQKCWSQPWMNNLIRCCHNKVQQSNIMPPMTYQTLFYCCCLLPSVHRRALGKNGNIRNLSADPFQTPLSK